MRISDWSSDVCSSDLELARPFSLLASPECLVAGTGSPCRLEPMKAPTARQRRIFPACRVKESCPRLIAWPHPPHRIRSEEHTSELQSLMRISYAVFCLKKKTTAQKRKTLNLSPK